MCVFIGHIGMVHSQNSINDLATLHVAIADQLYTKKHHGKSDAVTAGHCPDVYYIFLFQ